MIRQFFLNKVTIVCCTIFFMIGCSSDNIPSSENEELNDKRLRPIIVADTMMEVLIEYTEGISEDDKRKTRIKYINTGLLLGLQDCKIDNNNDVEVWIVDAIMYHSYKPGPIQHSNDDDVDRFLIIKEVTINANCEDYKKV
ncbi:hypothetical protein [uncultured Aquimarina sp.]|uniref:hypothetical protein n=1 Tax=uncultured Aquimarina sp. TaxID=575652 RepID=UPI00262ADB85|nr:hypothetical protein [uncultured Aquimarina sp.]